MYPSSFHDELFSSSKVKEKYSEMVGMFCNGVFQCYAITLCSVTVWRLILWYFCCIKGRGRQSVVQKKTRLTKVFTQSGVPATDLEGEFGILIM